MDDVSTWKGAAERSFGREEEGEDVEVENSIADDFGSYDCFMQPFHSPDEGDEQTKKLEMECFDKIDKSNSDHKVTVGFFIRESMQTLRAMLFNHDTSYATRKNNSEFPKLELKSRPITPAHQSNPVRYRKTRAASRC